MRLLNLFSFVRHLRLFYVLDTALILSVWIQSTPPLFLLSPLSMTRLSHVKKSWATWQFIVCAWGLLAFSSLWWSSCCAYSAVVTHGHTSRMGKILPSPLSLFLLLQPCTSMQVLVHQVAGGDCTDNCFLLYSYNQQFRILQRFAIAFMCVCVCMLSHECHHRTWSAFSDSCCYYMHSFIVPHWYVLM